MHYQENTRVENTYNGRKTISEFPKHLYLVCRNQQEEHSILDNKRRQLMQ